jgi:ribose transport system substrate-binding protein
LEQAGRPLPKIVADGTNMCSYLAYWKNHDLDGFTLAGGGAPMAFGALQVAIRAMSGQKPKVNTIYMPIPVITNANLKDYYKPGMTVQDTCWADPPDGPPGAGRLFRPVLHQRAAAAEDSALVLRKRRRH